MLDQTLVKGSVYSASDMALFQVLKNLRLVGADLAKRLRVDRQRRMVDEAQEGVGHGVDQCSTGQGSWGCYLGGPELHAWYKSMITWVPHV